jgi:glycosyltransferase involved in cell wall biosynthesis
MPEISVVVPAHARPLRLRWLLNALEEQRLSQSRFEVLVSYDAGDVEIAEIVSSHPLARAGVLRALASEEPAPAKKRNSSWRAARAPSVLFTDDDCRPPEGWLEAAVHAVQAHPGAVIQGRTQPEPTEVGVAEAAPHARSQWINPPTRWGQTCNILYPAALLERLGGFDPTFRFAAGEDTDLLLRALAAGAPLIAAPEMLTYHAVDDPTLLGRLRTIPRWGELARVVRRHPEIRRHQPLRIFWKPTHPALLVAAPAAALGLRRRRPGWLVLALPWAVTTWPSHGRHPRGLLRSLSELPAHAVLDAAEVVALARGSVRHRSLFL